MACSRAVFTFINACVWYSALKNVCVYLSTRLICREFQRSKFLVTKLFFVWLRYPADDKITGNVFCVCGLNSIPKWLESPADESSEMLLRDLVIKFTPHFLPPPPTPFSVSLFIVYAQCYSAVSFSSFVRSDFHKLHSCNKRILLLLWRIKFSVFAQGYSCKTRADWRFS